MPAKSQEAIARNRAINRANYRMYVESGICVICKTRYAEPGRTQCKDCTRRIAARADQRDPGRERRNAYCRERRQRLKAAGICVVCGQHKAQEGVTRCPACLRKERESHHAYEVRRRIARQNKHTEDHHAEHATDQTG